MTSQTNSLATDERPGAFSDSDPIVLTLTIGFILLFVGASIIDSSAVASAIGAGFTWTAKYLGRSSNYSCWQPFSSHLEQRSARPAMHGLVAWTGRKSAVFAGFQ